MYLVDFNIFKDFLEKNDMFKNETPIFEHEPFILEFKRGNILMAKIEMSSIKEYKFLLKYPKSYNSKKSINKYWIRGDEWKVINGIQIKELAY